jgi:hypothetical protein
MIMKREGQILDRMYTCIECTFSYIYIYINCRLPRRFLCPVTVQVLYFILPLIAGQDFSDSVFVIVLHSYSSKDSDVMDYKQLLLQHAAAGLCNRGR